MIDKNFKSAAYVLLHIIHRKSNVLFNSTLESRETGVFEPVVVMAEHHAPIKM